MRVQGLAKITVTEPIQSDLEIYAGLSSALKCAIKQ